MHNVTFEKQSYAYLIFLTTGITVLLSSKSVTFNMNSVTFCAKKCITIYMMPTFFPDSEQYMRHDLMCSFGMTGVKVSARGVYFGRFEDNGFEAKAGSRSLCSRADIAVLSVLFYYS